MLIFSCVAPKEQKHILYVISSYLGEKIKLRDGSKILQCSQMVCRVVEDFEKN